MTAGAARGATLIQRLDGVRLRAPAALRYRTLPRCEEERAACAAALAVARAGHRPLVSSLEAPNGAAAAAQAQFAAAVAQALAEADASRLLVRAWFPLIRSCLFTRALFAIAARV